MFLLDLRSIINKDGLLGFKTYLSLILDEIIEGKNKNAVQDLALERLVGYYSTYRNEGDLDFRSGEIYDEIKKLSDAKRVSLAKKLKELIDSNSLAPVDVDYSTFIKSVAVKDD
jgi:hypothetical protein